MTPQRTNAEASQGILYCRKKEEVIRVSIFVLNRRLFSLKRPHRKEFFFVNFLQDGSRSSVVISILTIVVSLPGVNYKQL